MKLLLPCFQFPSFQAEKGSDGFRLALFNVSGKLNGLEARIVRTQHDEIIVEAREDIAGHVQPIVEESMEAALKRIIPEVPFVVEIKVADPWEG